MGNGGLSRCTTLTYARAAGIERKRLGSASIGRLPGDDSADAAPRLIDVPPTARDEMDMAVHDRLPCRRAAVHPHIEAFDCLVCSEQALSHSIQDCVDRAPLRIMEIEIGRCMTAWN